MFYSDVILSKRGPLAKVWLAAHAEKRLSKTQLLHTDIEKSVESIIGPDVVPMALRLSGQLLLGVVRIYSRKAKYLLDDCNDAMMKLKTAFRTGAVDFTTDTAHGSHTNVTLPVARTAYDFILPDPALEGWDAESSMGGGSEAGQAPLHSSRFTARPEDITLRRYLDPAAYRSSGSNSMVGWASGDFFDPDGSNVGSLEGGEAVGGVLERRDSQGRRVDASGDPIEEVVEEQPGDTSSIGIGRDAAFVGGTRPSLTVGGAGDLTGFEDFGADDFMLQGGDAGGELTTEGLDLGLEEFDAQRRSATPQRDPSDESLLTHLTPRTAQRVQQAAQKRLAAVQKARKLRLIDARTQLDDNSRAGRKTGKTADDEGAGIVLAEETYLPRSRDHLYLLSVHDDPSKGVLPFQSFHPASASGRQQFTAARSLAPQLGELFTFDASTLTRRRAVQDDEQGPAYKRPRAAAEEGDDDDEFGSEIGRRRAHDDASGAFDLTLGDVGGFEELGGAVTFDDQGMEFDLDIIPDVAPEDEEGAQGLRRSQRKRASDVQQERREEEDRRRQRAFHEEGALQRLATPSEHSFSVTSDHDDPSPTSSYPLRAFDVAPSSGEASTLSGGVSRNTARAVKVLRTQLQPTTERGEEAEETSASLGQITRNASRRAAAAFFFEVLALGTKDCLNVEQEEPYGEITIEAKPRLWTTA